MVKAPLQLIGFHGIGQRLGPLDSTLYALLGIGFLFVSPVVGGVLLTVGLATFAVFRWLARARHGC